MRISVIIKAFNEERNIARAIESSLKSLDEAGGGEVIVADSLSSDSTVEIAQRYPVRIVQLKNAADRCCGIGAELGFRIAQGQYLYILDADMEFESGFLADAVRALDEKPEVAGVAGLIKEMHVENAEFRGRAANHACHLQAGDVDRLNGGGLFRRSAIESFGYLTNRNLHAFEEFELAVRLRSVGWRLVRLNRVAVRHYGHTEESFRLLARRWRQRYAWGAGELLREVWHTPSLKLVLRGIPLYRQMAAVMLWWGSSFVAAILAAAYGPVPFLVIFWLPFLVSVLHRKSLVDGFYVVAFNNTYAVGTLCGITSRRRGDAAGEFSYSVLT